MPRYSCTSKDTMIYTPIKLRHLSSIHTKLSCPTIFMSLILKKMPYKTNFVVGRFSKSNKKLLSVVSSMVQLLITVKLVSQKFEA